MVTRRFALKAIASALLAPAFAELALGRVQASEPTKRTTTGKSQCSPCQDGRKAKRAFSDVLTSAGLLGDIAVPLALTPRRRSESSGVRIGYVESSTGQLAFSVSDLEFFGTSGLHFKRFYSSASREDRGLGAGWSYSYDDYVVLNGSQATLHSATGERVAMLLNSAKTQFVPLLPSMTNRGAIAIGESGTLTESSSGSTTKTYTQIGAGYYLTAVQVSGHADISIDRDTRGNIQRITNQLSNVAFQLNWSADTQPRLLSVSDSTGRSVSFESSNGTVVSYRDANGEQWRYKYSDGHLATVTDPEGTVVLAVTYSSDSVSSVDSLYGHMDYQFGMTGTGSVMRYRHYDSPWTSIQHNADGTLNQMSDEGRSTSVSITYNELHLPLKLASSTGKTAQATYDSVGRRTLIANGKHWKKTEYDPATGFVSSVEDPVGYVGYTNDAQGNRTQASSTKSFRSYSAEYNGSQLSSVTTSKGAYGYKYNSLGNLTSVSSPHGTISYGRNLYGWMTSETLPNGYTSKCVRSAKGQVLTWSDSIGQHVVFHRDRRGALKRVDGPAGWAQAKRDDAGRITSLTNSRGQSRHFDYDQYGRLKTFTDALSRTFTFNYEGLSTTASSMQQTNGSLAYVRRGKRVTTLKNLGQLPVSTPNDGATGTQDISVYNDGWFDPLSASGLLGAFSLVTLATSSRSTLKSASESAAIGKPDIKVSDDDDDDDGGGGDDDDDDDDDGGSPGGDDDDDDDPDRDLNYDGDPNALVGLSTVCFDCINGQYINCESNYNTQMNAAIEEGASSLFDCGVDSYIEGLKADDEDEDVSFWTLFCYFTGSSGAALAAEQANSAYIDCMGSIGDVCSLDCPND